MKIFQRFEVWLLIALSAGAMILVFKPFSSKETEETGPVTHAAPADDPAAPALVVHRMSLVRDFGNARLDIDARLTNKLAKKIQLTAPAIQLISGKDHPVPEFFLPVEPPPEIPAKTTADVRLRYWLEKGDLAGPLTLKFADQAVELKSAKPFDLSQLKNAEPRAVGVGEW